MLSIMFLGYSVMENKPMGELPKSLQVVLDGIPKKDIEEYLQKNRTNYCKYITECKRTRRFACNNGGGPGCRDWQHKSDVEQFGEKGAQLLARFTS